MRKLILLISLLFTAYYGSSLWTFSDAESFATIANYLPLALLVLMFIIGLLSIRTAVSLGAFLIILCGNPGLVNEISIRLLNAPDTFNLFSSVINPIESIILGTFSAWILIRFFGNPTLDYEFSRSQSARALHFPIFIFALTAFISAIYVVLLANNAFAGVFYSNLDQLARSFPPAFFGKANILLPLRSVIILLEGVAVYIMVVNEFHSAKQIRTLVGTLLAATLTAVGIGLIQRYLNVGYTQRMWQFNYEIQSTFASPNAFSVFLLAMLPCAIGLLFRSLPYKIIGMIISLAILAGIIITTTKSAIMLAVLFIVVVFLITLIRAIKTHCFIQPVFLGLILIFPLIAYLVCKPLAVKEVVAEEGDAPVEKVETSAISSLATKYVVTIDKNCAALFKGKAKAPNDDSSVFDIANLNKYSNFKIGDWMTAYNMVDPTNAEELDNFLVGVGPGNLARNYGKYHPAELHSARGRNSASNMFLQTFAENGIFNVIALLIISIYAIFAAFRSANSMEHPIAVRFLGVSLLLLILGCMAENAFLTPQIQFVFWAFAGLCVVSASLAEKEPSRSVTILSLLILLGSLGAAAYVYCPVLLEQKEQIKIYKNVAAEYSETYGLDQEALTESLEKTGDYNFRKIGRGNWSEKESYMYTHVTNKIMSVNFGCSTPDCTTNKPVNLTISINNTIVKKVKFMSFPSGNTCEVDISKFAALEPLIENENYILVKFTVDRTWIPAEFYPKSPDDTFDVGIHVSPIAWRDTFSPPKPTRKSRKDLKAAKTAKLAKATNDVSNLTTTAVVDDVKQATNDVNNITKAVIDDAQDKVEKTNKVIDATISSNVTEKI